ncbi:MAG: hypothetical protein KDA70_14700 [Planctomycetaceae bacterium]|nr:hypothetical protein [Planctomycetaceae bacterium]MCA9019014.1 hypothetical protein [Planctomycetaceae bacterium]
MYIESQAKQGKQFVEISIKIHFVNASGRDSVVDIESYNPFFGCDVGRLEWHDENVALLVYREKHWTFIYRIGDQWPPQYAKLADRWQILVRLFLTSNRYKPKHQK